MVDNPDKLSTICLRKLVSVLKYDEFTWKKQIEECIDQIYQKEKDQLLSNDQRKRKYNTTNDDTCAENVDFSHYEVNFI